MARALRIEYEGAFYHVVNRGIERRPIFGGNADCEKFLDICAVLVRRYKVRMFAYCLLPNHYHMFLQTIEGGLRRFMQDLGGQYGRYFNLKNRRVGPVVQGRYKARLVDADSHALAVARYIHLNPVAAGLTRTPEGYRWSSYRHYLGKDAGIVDVAFLLEQFGRGESRRIAAFRRFTLSEQKDEYDPDAAAEGGLVVGGAAFVNWVKRQRVPRRKDAQVSRLRELQRPMREVVSSMDRRVRVITQDARLRRKLLVYGLRRSTSLKLSEVARMVGMKSICAVSQTVRRLQAERKQNGELDRVMRELERQCRDIEPRGAGRRGEM